MGYSPMDLEAKAILKRHTDHEGLDIPRVKGM